MNNQGKLKMIVLLKTTQVTGLAYNTTQNNYEKTLQGPSLRPFSFSDHDRFRRQVPGAGSVRIGLPSSQDTTG